MPLHAQHPSITRIFQLDSLDQSVAAGGYGGQTGPEAVDGLMVMGGTAQHRPTPRLSQKGALGHLHVMENGEVVARLAVQVHPLQVRQMLVQRSAQSHVENLHAPADGEDGTTEDESGTDESEFGGVPGRVHPVHLRVGLAAVAGGMDIAAAGQEEPVEGRQRGLCVSDIHGGKQDGPGTRSMKGGHVGVGNGVAAARPVRHPAGGQVVGGNGHEGRRSGAGGTHGAARLRQGVGSLMAGDRCEYVQVALRVWIDQDLCTGDGLCVDHAPDVFTLLEDGIAYVRENGTVLNDPGGGESLAEVPPVRDRDVILAAEDCPGECIFIEG